MIKRPEARGDGTRDALPPTHEMERAFAEIACATRIFQQIADGAGKILLGANLNDGLVLDEVRRDRLEVLHVGPDHDGNTGDGGFNDVMATAGGERAAHE